MSLEVKVSLLESENMSKDLKTRDLELLNQELTIQLKHQEVDFHSSLIFQAFRSKVEEMNQDQKLTQVCILLQNNHGNAVDSNSQLLEEVKLILSEVQKQSRPAQEQEDVTQLKQTIVDLRRKNIDLNRQTKELSRQFLSSVKNPTEEDLRVLEVRNS